MSPGDAAHLRRDFSVTHVLSAESEQDDDGTWPDPTTRARYPWPDDGSAPPMRILQGAVVTARRWYGSPLCVLYTHCRLGGSRGPTMAYLVLRANGYTYDQAIPLVGVRQDGQALHASYIAAIELAVQSTPT